MNQSSNVIPYETFFTLKFLSNSIKFFEKQDNKKIYEKDISRQRALYKEALKKGYIAESA